jgi:hypothetical protein
LNISIEWNICLDERVCSFGCEANFIATATKASAELTTINNENENGPISPT